MFLPPGCGGGSNSGRGRAKEGGEKLGYLRGGFRQLFEAVGAELHRLGVDVQLGATVDSVRLVDGRATGVSTSIGEIEADAVLYTGPLPGINRLVPADQQDPRWSQIGGLGVLCVVLELDRPMTDVYWTNVCDPAVPFGGIIEHTNMLPPSDYGDRRVVYLSRYFTHDEPIAQADPREEANRWIAVLGDKLPGFDPSHVLAVHPFTTPYAAPLVTLGHKARIPPMQSHIPGLLVSTTAQIYPQDRGMSEGVRTGQEAADATAAASTR